MRHKADMMSTFLVNVVEISFFSFAKVAIEEYNSLPSSSVPRKARPKFHIHIYQGGVLHPTLPRYANSMLLDIVFMLLPQHYHRDSLYSWNDLCCTISLDKFAHPMSKSSQKRPPNLLVIFRNSNKNRCYYCWHWRRLLCSGCRSSSFSFSFGILRLIHVCLQWDISSSYGIRYCEARV